MTSQTLPLNLIPKGVCPRLYVSQYDKGQEWNFDIYAGTEAYTIPSGASVKIQGTKPDKTGFQYACSFSGNRVTATEQQQMTIIAGEVPAEIRIEKNNEIIATLNFIIAVEKAALADDAVISETDLPLIEEAIEVLGHADELVSQIQGYATTAQNAASTATTKASQASTSATSASNSATTASNAATTATNKASEATSAASTATTKAGEASTSATSAAGSASTATAKAQEAAASAAAAAQSAAHLTIDSTMSTTSENALQNKVVTSAIQNLSTVVSKNGAKNLLPFSLELLKAINPQSSSPNSYYSWSGNVCTITSGITITVETDKDGNLLYVDVNGTASENTSFYLALKSVNIEVGDYLLSGCTGGSQNGYRLYANDDQYIVNHNNFDGDTAFTVTPAVGNFNVRIYVGASTVMNHVKFYPMIRLASDTDPTYQPYSKTNVELTADSLAAIDNRNILGAKNFMPLTLAKLKAENSQSTKTWNGNTLTTRGITATFDVDSDGNVTAIKATGTATGGDAFINIYDNVASFLPLKKGSYILNGCPSGGNFATGYALYVYNSAIRYCKDVGEGIDFTLSEDSSVAVSIVIRNGTTISGTLTFKPMIRLASDTDPTYEPYAMTNQQLTKDKVGMDLLSEVGAVNHLNNTAVTAVENGITWTVYDDKSMNANGTQNAPGNSVFELGYQSLKKGTYRLTGCPEDGGYNTSIQLYLPNDQYAVDYGDGAVFTLNEDASCRCNIWVKHNASFSNKVFKPMIAPVSYNGPYVPYAKSNKELTEDVATIKGHSFIDGGTIQLQSGETPFYEFSNNHIYYDPISKRCIACVTITIKQLLTKRVDGVRVGLLPSGFSDKYPPITALSGALRAYDSSGNTYRAFGWMGTNGTLGMTTHDDIPIGATIRFYIEWSY